MPQQPGNVGSRNARRDMALAALVCAVVFALLTYWRIFYLHEHKALDETVRDIAMAFFPLAICVLAFDFWLRRARNEEIKELLKQEVERVLAARLDQLSDLDSKGLLRIRSRISNDELMQFVKQANRRLRVLVPWFVDPLALKPILRDKVQDPQFILQITMLRPTSPFLKKRGEIIQPTQPGYGRSESERTLMALKEALENARSNNVEVRVYDSLPSAFIVQSDDLALLGFHFNTSVALHNPHLEIALAFEGKPTLLGKAIQAELDKVAEPAFSDRVDLKSVKQIRKELTFHVM
jgi:hypothetical protein